MLHAFDELVHVHTRSTSVYVRVFQVVFLIATAAVAEGSHHSNAVGPVRLVGIELVFSVVVNTIGSDESAHHHVHHQRILQTDVVEAVGECSVCAFMPHRSILALSAEGLLVHRCFARVFESYEQAGNQNHILDAIEARVFHLPPHRQVVHGISGVAIGKHVLLHVERHRQRTVALLCIRNTHFEVFLSGLHRDVSGSRVLIPRDVDEAAVGAFNLLHQRSVAHRAV